MRRSLDHYLNLLKEYDPLTEEQHAAIESRIRREVIARYGRFAVPMQPAVHISEPARDGMLVLLRPAFVFAVFGVLIVGGVVAMRRFGGVRSMPSVEPVGSSVSVVAVAEPVMPGSGVAVSVFAAPSVTAPSAQPAVRRVQRSGGRRLNPAAGVFSRWGESVFSEEELLQSEREGKNVFPNS